jgi:hypothetical protein
MLQLSLIRFAARKSTRQGSPTRVSSQRIFVYFSLLTPVFVVLFSPPLVFAFWQHLILLIKLGEQGLLLIASCWGAYTVAWPIGTFKNPLFPYLQHLSVLVKLGEQGSLLVPAVGDPIRQPAVTAPAVVDTTGAGDTFTAAYAVATLEGKSPADALAFAGTFQACITSGQVLILCCLTTGCL